MPLSSPSSPFQKGIIVAYPTDTSFGLGVRADDQEGLEKLNKLKKRPRNKYFSLMTKDLAMLNDFADTSNYMKEEILPLPLTAILPPSKKLPITSFWPEHKVAFRISTIPEVAQYIEYPITATSANFTGQDPIFDIQTIKENFGDQVLIFPGFKKLPRHSPSAIWDFTVNPPKQIR